MTPLTIVVVALPIATTCEAPATAMMVRFTPVVVAAEAMSVASDMEQGHPIVAEPPSGEGEWRTWWAVRAPPDSATWEASTSLGALPIERKCLFISSTYVVSSHFAGLCSLCRLGR